MQFFAGFFTYFDSAISFTNMVLFTWYMFSYGRIPSLDRIGTCAASISQCDDWEQLTASYKANVRIMMVSFGWMFIVSRVRWHYYTRYIHDINMDLCMRKDH
jgi:hypothetical protein